VAAIEIQRGLQAREWPRHEKVCVRVGIHSGKPTLSDSGYVGIAVHTAARICSAGHGGQVLASSLAIAELKARSDGMTFRSLGEYALPSLKDPLALFQIEARGLRRKFPALRSSDRG